MNPLRRLALRGLAAAACLPLLPAFAQANKAQAHETSIDGVTAEIVEAQRKEGVLTMKVRYRNTGEAPVKIRVYRDWNDTDYYVTSGSTKLMVLKDSKNVPVASPHGQHGETFAEIRPRGSFLFWAKYPAPPADAKKVSFYHPHSPPIEDIAITDAK
jgi:hypothetical protein